MISYLEKLVNAPTVEEVWDLHCVKMAEFGFDRLLYGFSRFSTVHSIGSIDDIMLLSNHSKAYLDQFINGLYHDAPMVKWMLDHEGACSWGTVSTLATEGKMGPGAKRVWEINRQHGVLAGVSISFPDASSRARGGIGLCAAAGISQAEVDDIWERNGRELMILNSLAHMRISQMPHATSRRALTPRQRESLEWVADGKTTADVAMLMGLTVATVEKHLRLAREALEVETTAQAVLKASLQKQIFLSTQAAKAS
ncbi:LuxR family transcriptional regulator [Thioclava sp. SK-1]|uniref:helix-turn-helix transcriptional regulator n=1 Tax=Thioclava sp. SK-1 TaxID=1889770 RepID=UPI0008254FCE|nr:LuxR family transcriptional regulator [Thioclava sp. SK-1]OCX63147.1 LuxR family transcriptional regulator [Thioclava sp. SK-1]